MSAESTQTMPERSELVTAEVASLPLGTPVELEVIFEVSAR